MKKVILSAAIIAIAATACTKSNDSASIKKNEKTVYILLDAPDTDNITSTTTGYKSFTVKQ
jgi:hypothetical protein